MPGQNLTLHSSGAVSDGNVSGFPVDTAVVQAHLDAAGGTAVCLVFGRCGTSGPWTQICSLSLSGANSVASWLIDGEPWTQLYGRVDSIFGASALATIKLGY